MDRHTIRATITAHGQRRREALEAAERELDAVVALVPEALAAGLTKSEIHRLGSISRPTLDAKLSA